MITKEQFLAAYQKPSVKALSDVPGFEGTVYVRKLSGADRDSWEAFITNSYGKDGKALPTATHVRATLVAKGLCDENGKRLFTDADIPTLSETVAGDAMEYLFVQVRDYSFIGASAVETAEKN